MESTGDKEGEETGDPTKFAPEMIPTDWSYEEHTIQLVDTGDTHAPYAWVYTDSDDHGLYSPRFQTQESAIKWMDDRTRGQYLVKTKIK